jgi:hypothetical protein
MSDLRDAARQALEALEQDNPAGRSATITVLKAALEQPEQEQDEPVALCDPAEYDDFRGAVSRNCAAANSPKRPAPVTMETVYETIINWDEGGGKRSRRELARRIVSLYTHPPRREWRGLTDEEVFLCLKWEVSAEFLMIAGMPAKLLKEAKKEALEKYRAIEAALKEKNK